MNSIMDNYMYVWKYKLSGSIGSHVNSTQLSRSVGWDEFAADQLYYYVLTKLFYGTGMLKTA